jgi:hypothetical protein
MKVLSILGAALAISVQAMAGQGTPADKPHMHYEIRLLDNSKLSADDLLQGTCDAAEELMDDLRKQPHLTSAVKMDARTIHDLACRTFKAARPHSN